MQRITPNKYSPPGTLRNYTPENNNSFYCTNFLNTYPLCWQIYIIRILKEFNNRLKSIKAWTILEKILQIHLIKKVWQHFAFSNLVALKITIICITTKSQLI